MAELNRLPIDQQLRLVEVISGISAERLQEQDGSLARFTRDGKPFYRVRSGDFRCYFEIRNDALFSHYILHKKSLVDFIMRNGLPIQEETLAEQQPTFWRYLESFTGNTKNSSQL